MGLSDDQRAMLRLLAQREEGYEDIAALMGIGVDEVRVRVREAVAAMDEDARPAARPASTPEPTAESRPVAAMPAGSEELFGDPPKLGRKGPGATGRRSPKDRRRLVELIGAAVVVLLIVLFATGAVDIGGGDDSDSGSDSTSASSDTVASTSTKLTQAILEPVDGGDAKGLAVFGRSKGAVILLLQAEDLDPSSKSRSYAVSLARTPEERIPIAVTRVPESGTIEAQYPVPSEALGLLANGFDQMELSLVANADLKAALTEAGKEQQAPDYASEDVLRGQVTGPIVNAAEKDG